VSENDQALKDDVAFQRALADQGASGAAKDGAILVAVGVIFSLVSVQYWAIESGLVAASQAVRAWLWLDGAIPFVIANAAISAKFRDRPAGAASRALAATWSGVGTAFLVADAALYAASRALDMPLLVKWMFPLVLFVLVGAAWGWPSPCAATPCSAPPRQALSSRRSCPAW
jgi:hypothetical protein